MPVLEIRDLRHAYDGGVRAVDGVTLDIPAGLFGLLGPNGAGKSTLMRLIATLQVPTGGSIRLGDIDVILAEPGARCVRTLGYLPQDFGAYPRVSIEAMLDHLAVLKGVADRGERRNLVSALLHEVNLWPVRRRALERCSGGMRQRFGIAQALIGEPRLIVVDEPTAGLDPEERNRCLDLLARIGDDVVVILSTHIVADVADLCPRMAVLAQGRIILQGAPARLRASLAGRVWRKTVDRRELDAHRAACAVISTRLVEGHLVIHVLADAKPGSGFDPADGSLEDAYFAALAATPPLARQRCSSRWPVSSFASNSARTSSGSSSRSRR